MTEQHQIIIKPIVSEKSYALLDTGSYTFVVHADANKIEIRQAVEAAFGAPAPSGRAPTPNGPS